MTIQLQGLILIFMRITAFIVICPGVSFKGIPSVLKIGISAALSFLVYGIMPELTHNENMYYFMFFAIKEVAFGLALGFVTNLIFTTMEIAGQLIDTQVGFSMASVYDPSMGINASNYGRLYYWLSICTFFLLDMHHMVIDTLIKSFEYIPVTTITFEPFSASVVLNIFIRVFELAINLAAPIIIVVLITDVVLGIISRTVPQINVLMLGMPLKAMVSFFAALISISWIMNSIGGIIQQIPGYLEGFISIFT